MSTPRFSHGVAAAELRGQLAKSKRGHIPRAGPASTRTPALLTPTNASPTKLAPGTLVTPRLGEK